MSTPEHCDDDGKGGCAKHPPTMCLQVSPAMWHWLIDYDCPGRRCTWPAKMPSDVIWEEFGAQTQSMARAYDFLLYPKANMKSIRRNLRRIRAAEKLRDKGKVTPSVTFRG